MSNIVPLVQVNLNAFLKTVDNNSSMLAKLRRSTKLQDGFFVYRDTHHVADTFPLAGGPFTGTWRLGRIRLPSAGENTGEYDYIVEVYRRCLNKTTPVPMAFQIRCLDDADLAETLRSLHTGFNIAGYPSNWEVDTSSTFSKLGFDIC